MSDTSPLPPPPPSAGPSGMPGSPGTPGAASPAADRWGRRGLSRFLAVYGVGNLALYAMYLGVVSILLPVQVEAFDPASKEINLAVVTGVSAVFATLFNPIGGMLSDRSRTRWGRRNPWMLGGALGAVVFLAVMGMSPALWLLAVGWCIAQAMGNVYQAAITATVPDRVPAERRGSASAVMGIAQSLGMVAGSLVAARFVGRLELGYILLGAALVVVAVLFTALTHDPRGDELPPRTTGGPNPLVQQLKGFGSALRSPDFTWAFTSRALMMMGFFAILGYQVYILSDYIALPEGLSPTDAVPVLTIANTVLTVACTAVIGPVSDRIGRRRPFVLIAGLIAASATVVPVLVPTFTGILVWATIAGAAFGVFMAADHAIVTLVLPAGGDAARDLGVLNIANAGPQIIAPFVAGGIVVLFGGYQYLFIVGAVLSLLGALAITRVKGVA
ncbi:MFS transporter [Nocardiopsis sp. RSe5-2]|uniref:MFS transporter n=1 Tax=Nocardiopsis endophytica TaxID=3018445 RepID=A0ABT4TXL1_9ACTN|nr:MFS transporter [Nocardiopsis endophytica]MDA2809418.1 MFS transporter [Nocardiopsis endophytica]